MSTDHQLKAKLLVMDKYEQLTPEEKTGSVLADRRGQGLELDIIPEHITVDDIYVVWFCYILGGWKMLLSTTVADDRYYEATFDKAKGSIYLDTYKKESNEEYGPGHPIHGVA